MASPAHHLARQLARPSGRTGRLLGHAMDLANRGPTRVALDRLAAQPGEHVLDAGCGTGAALAQLRQRGRFRLTGIDPSAAMIAAAARRLGSDATLCQATTEAMPLSDASVDAALLLNVLYFCDADARMVAHLHRVLKPGGRLVAYVTHRDTMDRWSFASAGFHRTFDEAALAGTLAEGGFAHGRIHVETIRVTRNVKGLIATAWRS